VNVEVKFMQVREASGEVVDSPEAVISVMVDESKADRECFWVLHLNSANRLIEKELVSMGTIDSSLVHPREVFRRAVLMGGCGIITVHNHPSGQTKPSKEDRSVWACLDESGGILGIDVLDHLIITPTGEYYSHKQRRSAPWKDKAGT
jgi:DNA repair protein RadC